MLINKVKIPMIILLKLLKINNNKLNYKKKLKITVQKINNL